MGILFVTVRMNVFRYDNFDYGKFDLGNMTQMVWNTLNGRFMYLTDYFGTNLPRWAMSHVDPILLLFVPIFALFQSALTLVVSQLVLVIFSAVLIYLIARQHLQSNLSAFLIAVSYLFYPALGFILAWTGFHGITVAIPFFLGAFYIIEKMHKENNFGRFFVVLFWVLVVVSMSGKEEISLFIVMLGFFVWLVRKNMRLGLQLIGVGSLWFAVAFFVIIPAYSHYRVKGYERFAQSLGIDSKLESDVVVSNFFLRRYGDFGDSYLEVIFNMATQPRRLVRVLLGGDRLDNLRMTFEPLAYTPLLYPPILAIALPEFAINYGTTAGGIGTSEIFNHRISLIIPVLFISTIYGLKYLLGERKRLVIMASVVVLASNVYTTFRYENPVYLWITQAISKRVFAKEIYVEAGLESLEMGQRLRFSPIETNDRDCARKIVKMIPDNASVSGPDHLGAHLALRETYALFPALYDSADYVIIDVFAEKVARILEIDKVIIKDAASRVMKDENYKLVGACSNLFVFENVGPHGKQKLLPIQEKFTYDEKVDYEIFQSLTVVDYDIPAKVKRGINTDISFTYVRRGDQSLDGYVLFLTFINAETKDGYQVANIPSFGLSRPSAWTKDHYYIEDVEVVLPTYLEAGEYKVFVGMDNKVRTRSIYLGDMIVE
ncbi:DUF2079 domain-containing protein [candidate division WWE3 bacterium]|nr:DUF2079 domain-containing protein [candidate division WWE3 bacterium]